MTSRGRSEPAAGASRLGAESGDAADAWPAAHRAAVSISFDDGRPSQLERGIPVLDRYGLLGTFFVLPGPAGRAPGAWRRAAGTGHELGNHTVTHPCSGNFDFSRGNALEEMTLDRLRDEMAAGDETIRALAGRTPVSFAYPCGQRFVGRGAGCRSSVPLVAERYVVGRGFRDEVGNDPYRCDLAQAMGTQVDGMSSAALRALVDAARERGRWLILAAHEVAGSSRLPYDLGADVLDDTCRYLREVGDVWVAPVGTVGTHVGQLQTGLSRV